MFSTKTTRIWLLNHLNRLKNRQFHKCQSFENNSSVNLKIYYISLTFVLRQGIWNSFRTPYTEIDYVILLNRWSKFNDVVKIYIRGRYD